jgi:lipopolysaccharide/colanic/teichoic acid biosynthesis glycosyltransferase
MYRPDRRISLLTRDEALTSVDAETIQGMGLTVMPTTSNALAVRLPRQRQVVVSEEVLDDPSMADRLALMSLSGLRVTRLSSYYEQTQRSVMLDALDENWFFFDQPLRARRVYSAFKAVTDIIAGFLGSIVVLLFLPLVWLAVRLDDGGPVFFRQERVGLGGKSFNIWKFRTMVVDAEADGPAWAARDDDRATAVGRVLRRIRFDELPQFFNVMCGEMSLIGPRPERPVFVRTLGRAISYYDRRHMTKPGITGWATVRFGYGDSVNDKWRSHAYDLYYLKHRSVLLDVEIIFRTMLVMVLRRGQ